MLPTPLHCPRCRRWPSCAALALAEVLAGSLAANTARAADEWNGTLAATSRSVFRGVMQRGDAPSLQLDVHRAFDEGAFFGVWLARGPDRTGAYGRDEVNAYAGLGWRVLERWAFSLRLVHYHYPDSRLGKRYNYDELAGTATLDDWLVLNLSTSPNSTRFSSQGLAESRRSHAAELSLRQALWGPVSLLAGMGYYDTRALFGTAYQAVHVGLAARWGEAELTLVQLHTDYDARRLFGTAAANGHWALSVALAF
jgi:uncharacterized protein (TIGR02001 family)